jgi:pyruvate dehydrogenase (quinone)
MAENTADFLLARLREWGIHRIYGYPGDGINVILGAFNRAGSDPELIQVRHEEMAAFMACAHASSPVRSECAWPPQGQARFIC